MHKDMRNASEDPTTPIPVVRSQPRHSTGDYPDGNPYAGYPPMPAPSALEAMED